MEKLDRMSARESILGYRMGAELSAVASFGGERNAPGRLVQLSLEHLTLDVSASQDVHPGQTASVVLGVGERWMTALDAEVTHVHRSDAESPQLSLRFVAPPLETARRIVSVLEALRDDGKLLTPEARPVWKERITKPERIARICEALASKRSRGVARGADGRRVEVTAAFLDAYGDRIGWEFAGPVPRGPFALEVFGYSSVLHFEVERFEETSGLVLIAYPSELVRFRHRWLRRAPAHSGCTLSFTHPLWPQVSVGRSLLDVSYEGLSFFTEPGEDLLYPGMKLPLVEVAMAGRAPVRLRAEVRNISGTSRGRRCGMWIQPLDDAQGRAWRELVEEQMHPHTRVAGEWNEETWDLFERSGYFRLSGKQSSHFEAQRPSYEEAQGKLQGRPRLGYRVVRPSEDGVEATLSVVKPYAGSWLAHQLARQMPVRGPSGRRFSAREALRDVYLRGYEPAQLDPDVKWFFAYCDANARWMKPTQFEFAGWYEHTGQACLLDFRLMEGEVERAWPRPEGVEVAAPTEAESALFFERLKETKPEAFREALDLVPERFGLEVTKALWGSAQLGRERELLVARHEGRAVAFAVMEVAQQGLNLFNMLDGVRLVSLADDALAQTQDAMLALLGAAAEWFGARGRRHFVHYVEASTVEYCERAALADLGEAKLWIVSSALLPEFLEHVSEVTTPRVDM
ncbi:PilZ domain-containing protein [Myxococcaceae bacterium GXIMD 01537]